MFQTWRKIYLLEIIILDDFPFSPHVMRLQLIQIHSILKKYFFELLIVIVWVIFSRSIRLTIVERGKRKATMRLNKSNYRICFKKSTQSLIKSFNPSCWYLENIYFPIIYAFNSILSLWHNFHGTYLGRQTVVMDFIQNMGF